MMNRSFVVAQNSLQEMVREKFFLVIVFVAFGLFGMSLLLGALSFAEQKRILADMGLATIELSTLLMSLFQGSYVIQKEIDKQTCLVLLSKPLSRFEFLFGKWLGVSLLIGITQLALGLCLYFLLTDFSLFATDFSLFQFLSIGLSLFFSNLVILTVVIFLSVTIRPLFALLFGFSFYLLGHWLNDLKFFAEKSKDEMMILFSKIIHEVVPQFYRFNWKSYFFLQQPADWVLTLTMVAYYLVWIFLFLIFANMAFRRKDIA